MTDDPKYSEIDTGAQAAAPAAPVVVEESAPSGRVTAAEIEEAAAASGGQPVVSPREGTGGKLPPPVAQAETAAAEPYFKRYGMRDEQHFEETVGGMAAEIQRLRAFEAQHKAQGQAAPQAAPAAAAVQVEAAKLPKTYFDALGMTREEFNAFAQANPFEANARIQAHALQNHPGIQSIIEQRVKAIVEPLFGKLDQRATQLGETVQQAQARREQEQLVQRVTSIAPKVVSAFTASIPDFNVAATDSPEVAKVKQRNVAEFKAAVANENEYLFDAFNRGGEAGGRQALERIGGQIILRGQLTVANARREAAEKRVSQTQNLGATARPGVQATKLTGGSDDEETINGGRELGIPDDVLAQFMRTSKRIRND